MAIFAVFNTAPAHADTIYSLGTNTGLGCSPTCGTVDLAQDGAGVVLVTVTLNSPGVFVETGTHQDFDFNLPGTATVGNLSTGFTADPGPEPFTQPGLGAFTDSIDCNVGISKACGSGGSISTTSTFSFTVSEAGLTPASFTANGDGNYFSADILNVRTAAVGTTTTSVPEPGSVALLGMGVLGLLGFGLRRKRVLA